MTIPLFDAHCDTISRIYELEQGLSSNSCHIDFQKASGAAPYAQIFAFFADTGKIHDLTPFNLLYQQYRKFHKETELKNPGKVKLCLNSKDIEEAGSAGQIAAMLAVEGAELFDCSEAKLGVLFDLGVRLVTITWNHENELCGSCAESPEKGLTEKGCSMVRLMHRLGIITDVSHMSEAGFWDVRDISEEMSKPFIASHSNSKSLCGHRRNLTDSQFKAIVKSGGLAGINLYSPFLSRAKAGIDDAVAHIEHFLELGGTANIGIGADFDGCEELPEGIGGVNDMWKLYDSLLRRNYREDLVRDIFYYNLLRVVCNICDT